MTSPGGRILIRYFCSSGLKASHSLEVEKRTAISHVYKEITLPDIPLKLQYFVIIRAVNYVS